MPVSFILPAHLLPVPPDIPLHVCIDGHGLAPRPPDKHPPADAGNNSDSWPVRMGVIFHWIFNSSVGACGTVTMGTRPHRDPCHDNTLSKWIFVIECNGIAVITFLVPLQPLYFYLHSSAWNLLNVPLSSGGWSPGKANVSACISFTHCCISIEITDSNPLHFTTPERTLRWGKKVTTGKVLFPVW